jgi:hypothetical protein
VYCNYLVPNRAQGNTRAQPLVPRTAMVEITPNVDFIQY